MALSTADKVRFTRAVKARGDVRGQQLLNWIRELHRTALTISSQFE